jgi:hypothetical protein
MGFFSVLSKSFGCAAVACCLAATFYPTNNHCMAWTHPECSKVCAHGICRFKNATIEHCAGIQCDTGGQTVWLLLYAAMGLTAACVAACMCGTIECTATQARPAATTVTPEIVSV